MKGNVEIAEETTVRGSDRGGELEGEKKEERMLDKGR